MNKKITALLKNLAAIFLCIVHFAPLYIIITVAFKERGDSSSYWSLPTSIDLSGLERALEKGGLLNAIWNTSIVTVCSVVAIVIIGAMTSYPLARYTNKINKFMLNAIMAVMMVPAFGILVPLYKQMVLLGGINTYWGIIIVTVTYNLPMSIFLYTNFIKTIPKALDEAAQIDGCGRFSIFYRIIMPSLKPVTTSVIILTGVGIWNDYTFQLYFLQKTQLRTITLAVSSFFTQDASYLNAAASTALIAVIPPILVFIFLQRYFIQGVVDSSVK